MLRKLKNNWRRVAAVAIVVAGGGVAYAYWTTTGTGTGSAATGNTVGITVTQTSTPSGLYPGGAGAVLSGNFTNTNSGAVYVTSVNASISSVTGPNITAGTPCDATDYALAGFPYSVGHTVASGTGVDSWGGASTTVSLVNKAGSNQNGCKGATVNIAYTSN